MDDKITPFADNEVTTTEVFNQRIAQMNTALQEIGDPESGSIPKIEQEVTQLRSDVDAELAAQSEQLTALDAAKAGKSITAPVTLTAADWEEDAENGWWTQGISNPAIVDGCKVDITFAASVIKQLSENGTSVMVVNDSGTASAYAFGAKPSADLSAQIEIREVIE